MPVSVPESMLLIERMSPKKPPVAPSAHHGVSGEPAYASDTENERQGTTGRDIRYRVDELLKGGREAVLVHRGQEYRLRITSTGKLILTK